MSLYFSSIGEKNFRLGYYENFYKYRWRFTGRDIATLMTEPYSRVIVMHLTILLGGFLSLLLNAGEIGVIIMVIVKTIIDLISHHNLHNKTFNLQPSIVSDL